MRQARDRVEAIKISLENAQVLFKRRLDLIEVGGISQEDLDNAKTHHNELQAQLAQAEAVLAVALDTLSYTEAFAPTEGIILTRIREPGSVVNPTDPVL